MTDAGSHTTGWIRALWDSVLVYGCYMKHASRAFQDRDRGCDYRRRHSTPAGQQLRGGEAEEAVEGATLLSQGSACSAADGERTTALVMEREICIRSLEVPAMELGTRIRGRGGV